MQIPSFGEFAAFRALFPALSEQLAARSDEELYVDYCLCVPLTGAEPMDYFKYRFFLLAPEDRAAYLTRVQYADMCSLANGADARAVAGDKVQFARAFSALWGRRFVFGESSPQEFTAFCAEVEQAVVKPRRGGYGKGVEPCSLRDPERLWALCQDRGLIAEARIIQHEDLARIHRASVNCVRVATALDGKGAVHIIGAVLRMGRGGAFTDSGEGLFAPITVSTGEVAGPATDHFCNEFDAHPDSNVAFAGFAVPEWRSLLRRVSRAAVCIEGIRLANWDWACTASGEWILVEANVEGGFGPIQEAWRRGFAAEAHAVLEGAEGQ